MLAYVPTKTFNIEVREEVMVIRSLIYLFLIN